MVNDRLLNVTEVSDILGMTKITVRRLFIDVLPVQYTDGGHRRYKESDVKKYMNIVDTEEKKDLGVSIYCRVSSNEQKTKGDLERQKDRLVKYCVDKGYKIVSIYEEVGSGMNDNRKKLHSLFQQVVDGELMAVVCEHKDRLTRFNYKMYEFFFNSYGVEIIHVEEVLSKSFENELCEDMISLMASFSAKIYSKRSSKNRKKREDEVNKIV
jgi:putative resolvase